MARIVRDYEPLSPELQAAYEKDLKESPVRKLTSDERKIYSDAVTRAAYLIPAFRDAVSLMRPFMDAKAGSAYTDRYARVGLSYWFFYQLDKYERSAVILHECMHVLNNHFARWEGSLARNNAKEHFNIAGDFEINTTLNNVNSIILPGGLLPDEDPFDYEPNKTMEIYAELLRKSADEKKKNCEACKEEKSKGQKASGASQSSEKGENGEESASGDSGSEENSNGEGSGENSSASSSSSGGSGSDAGGSEHTCGQCSGKHSDGEGNVCDDPNCSGDNSWTCDDSTEANEDAADKAGISRASDVEQTIAKQNTAARIIEERNSGGRGNGSMDAFWDSILRHLTPPVVNWRTVLRNLVASSVESLAKGRANYTYRRPSRRLQHRDFVFPGMVDYIPKVAVGIDTSGSMGNEDYQKLLNEIEGLIKSVARGNNNVSIFSVDTKVGDIKPVSTVAKVRLNGGGGTQMALAWQYLKKLPKREQPDVLVMVGDGYWDWEDITSEVKNAPFKSVVCITQKGGYQSAPATLRRMISVLDISGDS